MLHESLLAQLAPDLSALRRLRRPSLASQALERELKERFREISPTLPFDDNLRSNATTLTIALIESRNGIDALDSILAVPGLDYIAIGANDLGLSMGTHGAMDDPAVRALLASAHDRIKAHGKSEVAVVGDAVEAASAIAAGAQRVAIPDTVLLADAARGFLGQVNHGRS